MIHLRSFFLWLVYEVWGNLVIVKLGSRTFDVRFLGVSQRTCFLGMASSVVFAIFVLVEMRSVAKGAKGIDVVIVDVALPLCL